MRYLWVDQTRLIAAFAVISIHAFSSSYSAFETVSDTEWWLANFIVTLGKSIANPIYAMLSGYLFLGRNTKTVPFIKTQLSRFLPVLVFWSVFYALFCVIFFDATLRDFLWQLSLGYLFTGKAYFHLWYLSTFIMMLMFAPFINQWIKGQAPTKKDIFILFGIIAAIFLMNSLSEWKGAVTDTSIEWHTSFSWYLAYFILGYYIGREKITQFFSSCFLVMLFTLCFFLCFAGNYLASSLGIIKDNLILSNTGVFGFIMAVCAFSLFSRLSTNKVSSSRVQAIATTAFGIYLIHPALLYFSINFSKAVIPNVIIQLLIAIILTFIASTLTIYFFRKTAIGKRLT
jgi:surface polysaccharide O-acyltransferase-like enzyme